MQTCKRLGCGLPYSDADNVEGCCKYHPGWPAFSNLSKQWSCCKAEKFDWDEFMKVPGCMVGIHTDVKPVQPKAVEPPLRDPLPTPVPIAPSTVQTAPSANQHTNQPIIEQSCKPFVTPSGKLKCVNAGCNKEYEPEDNSETACDHHPGKALFRDTKKCWTCCEQYAYDWDDFMKLKTCLSGQHKPKMVPL